MNNYSRYFRRFDMFVRLVLVAALFALLGVAAVAAPLTGTFVFTLQNALRQGNTSKPLDVTLTVRDGVWEKNVYGFASTFNTMEHEGTLADMTRAGDALTGTLSMSIKGDAWVPGGSAQYALTLKRDGERVTGTFTGDFAGKPTMGAITGTFGPVWPATVEGHVPITAGEHPRLLFRKGDIQLLGKRAETPEGKAIVARLRETLKGTPDYNYSFYTVGFFAAGHAFLYTLTGDKTEAEEARKLVVSSLSTPIGMPKAYYRALQTSGIALAYDLCYDAWEPDFRWWLAGELEAKAEYLRVTRVDEAMNPSAASVAWSLACMGLADLAIIGDPAPLRPKPAGPQTVTIDPPKDFVPAAGAPVLPFVNDAVPAQWLVASPIARVADEDPLLSIGGREKANPGPDTAVTFGEQTAKFTPLPDAWRIKRGKYQAIDLKAANQGKGNVTTYYYTVLKVEHPVLAQITFESAAPQKWNPTARTVRDFWLGGVRLQDGDFVRLSPGLYPFLAQAKTGSLNVPVPFAPHLAEFTEADAAAIFARFTTDYAPALHAWEVDNTYYEAHGKSAITAEINVGRAERAVQRFLTLVVKPDGEPATDSWLHRARVCGMQEFLAADRCAHGIDPTASTGAPMLLPALLAHTSSSGHGGSIAGDFALGFGLVAPDRLAEVKAGFDKLFGLAGDKSFDISMPHHAISLLAQYPFDFK